MEKAADIANFPEEILSSKYVIGTTVNIKRCIGKVRMVANEIAQFKS